MKNIITYIDIITTQYLTLNFSIISHINKFTYNYFNKINSKSYIDPIFGSIRYYRLNNIIQLLNLPGNYQQQCYYLERCIMKII